MNVRRVAVTVGVLVMAVSAVSLAADLARTMRGKWKADMVATLTASAMYKKMPAGAQQHMLEEMKKAPDFLFEFTDTTIVSTNGDAPPDNATYKVVKTEGKVIAIQITSKKKDGTDITEDTDVEVVDPDSIKLSKKGDDDMVLILHRVK